MQQFSLLPREKSTFPCILQEFFREFPLSPATPGPAKVPPVFSSAFQDGVPDYLLRVVLETVTAEASGPDIPAHQANHLLFGLLPDLYQELRQHVHLFGELPRPEGRGFLLHPSSTEASPQALWRLSVTCYPDKVLFLQGKFLDIDCRVDVTVVVRAAVGTDPFPV